jgi:phage tail-like protein
VAQSPAQQRGSHPLVAYNFRVAIDGADMRFAKVSGLQREYQTATYRHGLSFLEGEQITKFSVAKYTPITLEQGTVIGHTFLYEWLDIATPCFMQVSLCDQTGTPVVMWTIARALPVKVTAPTFDASSNQVSIDVLEVRAAGISVKHVG